MYRFGKRKGPLYVRIKDELLSKIQRGIWPIDAKLPTENELIEQYNVSRGTIRQALSELEEEGYITRMAAKGTFVTRVTKLEKDMAELSSFTNQLENAGLRPYTTVLSAKIIKASQALGRVIEGFRIGSDAEVVHIKRLKAGSGVPFAIQSVYLLPELCPGILEQDLTQLFKLYEERYDRRIMVAHELLLISSAGKEEVELLKVKKGTPVMVRDRVSYDQDDLPFEVLHSIDRGDITYRYTIVNDLTKSSDAVGQEPALPVPGRIVLS